MNEKLEAFLISAIAFFAIGGFFKFLDFIEPIWPFIVLVLIGGTTLVGIGLALWEKITS